ncbi:MAG: hypothetical protein LQ350_002946 [Teloschistes chrysophthalmus]|nr:MAG: hypothetical protein LQ350_002946 [Niorma chrysophthalma]
MYLTASLVALSGLFCQSLAAPNGADIRERGPLPDTTITPFATEIDGAAALQNDCNRDNLLRSFVDPRYSASASAFCSTYIQPTVKSTNTVTTTVPAATKVQRDFATGTYPPSRLSSACSCILTASPPATTVVTTIVATITAASTATSATSSCAAATPILKNGDFETGALAPWEITNVIPPLPAYEQYLSLGVQSPGYAESKYAFVVTNNLASSYVEVDLSQNLTLCAGTTYKFAAEYYQTGSDPETHVEVFVDEKLIAQSPSGQGTANKRDVNEIVERASPAPVWTSLSGTFTAGASGTGLLKVSFVATNYLTVQWGLDNVVVTPV